MSRQATDFFALMRRQRISGFGAFRDQTMVFLYETMPSGIAHGVVHPVPDRGDRFADRVSEAHGGEVARADFSRRINEHVLGPRAATEDFRAFDMIEGADLGQSAFSVHGHMKFS